MGLAAGRLSEVELLRQEARTHNTRRIERQKEQSQ